MRLRVGSFPFPFRTRFEHAAAKRDAAANVIVVAEDGAGRVGLGEGCPREYVTGETVESAVAAIERWRAGGIDGIETRAELEAWMDEHTAEIDLYPSAFAAVELALLDVLARRADQSLEDFLGVPAHAELRASAVYGSASTAKFAKQLLLFNLNGMHDSKLKLTGDGPRDARRALCLARFGRVRLDANNLWSDAERASRELGEFLQCVWAVEEPLRAQDWAGLATVGTRTGLAVVLDESVTRIGQLASLVPGPAYVLNARVSKCGGLLRTLAIVRAAQQLGLRIVVGAQVGETSILARAGIVAANAVGSNLAGFEGAFGTRLLTRDATTASIGFGYGGRVDLSGVGSAGSGLAPTREVDAGAK